VGLSRSPRKIRLGPRIRITVSSANEAKVVDLICIEIDKARDRVTGEASWERLTQFFYEQLVHELPQPLPLAL